MLANCSHSSDRSALTLVTATWNVNSEIGRGVLLVTLLLISMTPCWSAGLDSSHAIVTAEFVKVIADGTDGGRADSKFHSSSAAADV